MKLTRVVFYALMAASLLAGLYSGLRVFYILFFCGLFLIASTIMLNIFTIYSFRFTEDLLLAKCVKDEHTVLELDLRNETLLPLSMMNIHVVVASPFEKVNLVLNLSPFSGKKFSIPLRLPYRGHYRVGMTRILINDIFGLVPFRFDMRRLTYYRMKNLLVLPKVSALESIQIEQIDAKVLGSNPHRSEENPENYSESRLFRTGDTTKRILWKKSFQQRRFYIRQYDVPARETVLALIDTTAHNLSGVELLKYADTLCEYAATLCLNTIRYGKKALFLFSEFPDDSVDCDSIERFNVFREKLAYLPFSGPPNPEEIQRILLSEAVDYSDILLITRDASPSLISILNDLQTAGKNVTLIIVGESIVQSGNIRTQYIRDNEEIPQLFDTGEK